MKNVKAICKELKQGLTAEEMRDKVMVKDYMRRISDENEKFGNMVFEAGISAIWKECKKVMLARKPRSNVRFIKVDIDETNLGMLKDASVYLVSDKSVEDGVEFVFRKKNGKYINLRICGDSAVFVSEEY